MADIISKFGLITGEYQPLSRDFYLQDTIKVAQNLLGCAFVRRLETGETVSAVITETEAYLADDPASHSFAGPTRRNQSMYSVGGTLYVYLIYGVHHCINVVTGASGLGEAVLIRRGVPIEGKSYMLANRGPNTENKLLSGPGNFARAYGFSLRDDGSDLCSPNLFISKHLNVGQSEIFSSKRIGISKGKDFLYRYHI